MLKTIKASRSVTSYFKEFAEIAELVYFGDINKEDDICLYKGVTFSPKGKDSHYCHGTINDYDVAVFSRHSTHAGYGSKEVVSDWTIVATHLKTGDLPHVLLDARKHEKTFYQSLFMRFPRLRKAGSLLTQINQSAALYFDMYLRPENNAVVSGLFDDLILQRLITSFSKYSIEIDNDMIYVFKIGHPAARRELTDMLQETLWLAETIENRAHRMDSISVQPI